MLFVKQKTAYEIPRWLEFRRVLFRSIFLVIPLISLFLYTIPDVIAHIKINYPTRTFSAYTRLLSEANVLIDYIINILFPRPKYFGLFHSDYVVSKSLFTPFSTFIYTSIIVFLLTVSFKTRKLYQIGRAHVWTPVTDVSRMPSSAWKKKKTRMSTKE